jgi:phosphoribosylaminoimidazole-succinocarboxamide synthase
MLIIGNVEIENLEKIKSGKVREMFSFEGNMLIVTTDRVSAFDYILPTLIPYKGIILNRVSNFWFDHLKDVINNHIIETNYDNFPKLLKKYKNILQGRSVIVKKANIYPIECVVRGYITGSAWNEYKDSQKISDLDLPKDLMLSSKLPEPIFTPTTKEVSGHDIAITIKKAKSIFGSEVIEYLQKKSIELYSKAAEYAYQKGIIIADTKFEFGQIDEEIILVDEALTPDSSRFWFLDEYEPGRPQKSLDKQFLRDWLLESDWDRKSIPPELPEEIAAKTSQRYITVYEKLLGKKFEHRL